LPTFDNDRAKLDAAIQAGTTQGDALKLLEAVVTDDRAAVENLREQLSACSIKAPLSGRVEN